MRTGERPMARIAKRRGTALALAVATAAWSWTRVADAADAHGTFTAESVFDCSGTGDFEGVEDLCEGCDSDGAWDVSVSPAPGPGSLAGSWLLFWTETQRCLDEDPETFPRELLVPAFEVVQTGGALSASFLASGGSGPVETFFGASCNVSCPSPGSCAIGCPSLGVDCVATCTPPTEDCREPVSLSGSITGGDVQITLGKSMTISASCPGFGTLTIVSSDTAHLVGTIGSVPEPGGSGAALAALYALRRRSRRREPKRGRWR